MISFHGLLMLPTIHVNYTLGSILKFINFKKGSHGVVFTVFTVIHCQLNWAEQSRKDALCLVFNKPLSNENGRGRFAFASGSLENQFWPNEQAMQIRPPAPNRICIACSCALCRSPLRVVFYKPDRERLFCTALALSEALVKTFFSIRINLIN